MRLSVSSLVTACALTLGGCALTSNVEIEPLVLTVSESGRDNSVVGLFKRGEYGRIIDLHGEISEPEELLLLAKSELYAMRLQSAFDRFNEILTQPVSISVRREAWWGLARIAQLEGDQRRTIDMALKARSSGLNLKQWFVDLNESLLDVAPFSESPGSARTTEVPMEIDHPNLPRINVVVNGTTLPGIIDTGAALTIISESRAKEADVKSLGGFEGEISGLLGVRISVRFGLIERLSIGDIVVRDVPVAILRDHRLRFRTTGGIFDIDMLIGIDLLRHFRITLDPEALTFALERFDPSERLPAHDQNLFLAEARPMVAAALNGEGMYPMILDTGSEVTFLNQTNPLVIAVLSAFPRYHSATLQSLDGTRGSGAHVENVRVGLDQWQGRFARAPLYNDSRRHSLGVLGQNFLRRFRTTIDFATMRVELERLD